MRTLGIREVRQRYEILKETLDAEGEVILTHHGKPFARVLPIETTVTPKQMPSNAELRAKMKPLKTATAVYIRQDRDARG